MVFYLVAAGLMFVIWIAILVAGFGFSAVAVASGVVYYVRQKSRGPIAR